MGLPRQDCWHAEEKTVALRPPHPIWEQCCDDSGGGRGSSCDLAASDGDRAGDERNETSWKVGGGV